MIRNPVQVENDCKIGKKLLIILSVLYVSFEIWVTIVNAVNRASFSVAGAIPGVVVMAAMVTVILLGYKYFVFIVGFRFVLNMFLFLLTIAGLLKGQNYYATDIIMFSYGLFVSLYGAYLMFFSKYVKEYYFKKRSTRTFV